MNWENNILGLVSQDEWLNVGFQVTRQNDPIDTLFGDERTDNLVAKWNSIAAEYQVPMMAQFHGFDTEAQQTFRVPVDTHNVEKGLIKVKINQSERLRTLLRSGVREEALYDYVLNDGINLSEQVFTRSKVAKNELMATGKVTIKENNLDLTVDYGVQSSQTGFELDLSTDADIPGQIQAIIDAAADAGKVITGMLTSKKNLTKMRANTAIQRAINGNIGTGAMVRSSALTAYLEDEFGLTRIITNDLTYGASAAMGEGGRPVITQKKYYPQNRVTFFAANPAGRVGVGLWGDPPEVDAARFGGQVGQSSAYPYVYVKQWMEDDPEVLWTKASGLFMPVLYDPSSLWIATVVEPQLGELTVDSAASSTTTGKTKLTVSPGKESASNVYKVKAGATAPTVTYGQNLRTWSSWDGTSELAMTTGQEVTVAECTSDYRAIRAGSDTVAAKDS